MAHLFRQARNLCFTILKDVEAAWDRLTTMPLDVVSYIVFQQEECPKTKKLHIQGYAEFSKQLTPKAIRELFQNNSLHMEVRHGPQDKAIRYCKMDVYTQEYIDEHKGKHNEVPQEYLGQPKRLPGTEFVERGVAKEQGRRKDLEEVAEMLREGKGMYAVAEAHPMQIIRHFKGLQALELMIGRKRNVEERPFVYFIWGPPGKGKSLWAHHKFPDAYIMEDTPQGWLDGYAGQEVIIIDEFRGDTPVRMMLKLMDYYAFMAPVKSSHCNVLAKKIVITANKPPEHFYTGLEGYDPWIRRIQEFGQIIDITTRDDIAEFVKEKKRKQMERAPTPELI